MLTGRVRSRGRVAGRAGAEPDREAGGDAAEPAARSAGVELAQPEISFSPVASLSLLPVTPVPNPSRTTTTRENGRMVSIVPSCTCAALFVLCVIPAHSRLFLAFSPRWCAV